MKLIDYIKKHHQGNVSEFARVHGYHLTQVVRCINHDGYWGGGSPYFKKYIVKAQSEK